MGKEGIRTVRISKRASALLLLLASALLVGLFWFLSGRAYVRSGILDNLQKIRTQHLSVTDVRFIALVTPAIADLLTFVPWGFFFWIVMDRPGRARVVSYLVTFAAGLAFAMALSGWQTMLITRVTTYADACFQAAGAVAGAVLAHLRKSVRLRFQPGGSGKTIEDSRR